jgi:alpha-tubulin suppressor-like RCC1 family protein
MEGITGATAVSCGYYHTAILAENKVYSCGYNYYGQLGYTANNRTNDANPKLIDMGKTGATAVSCGGYNTAI